MISLNRLDAFQALGFLDLDVEAHSSTLSLHISGELLKKIPAPTIPYCINRSLMFSAPPFHCGGLRMLWRVTVEQTRQVTLCVTVRVTPGGKRSGWEHVGCAWRDYRFGRGQNTTLGWSDPTFWHCAVAKVTRGVAPARPEQLGAVFCPRAYREVIDPNT